MERRTARVTDSEQGRQGQLIEEISLLRSESVTGDWTKLVLNRRALSMFSEETMQVTHPDGSTTGMDRNQPGRTATGGCRLQLRR